MCLYQNQKLHFSVLISLHLTVLSTTSHCSPSFIKSKKARQRSEESKQLLKPQVGSEGWWNIVFEDDAQFPGESVWFRWEGQNRKGRKKASTVSSPTQHVLIQPLLHRPIGPHLSASSCFPGKNIGRQGRSEQFGRSCEEFQEVIE